MHAGDHPRATAWGSQGALVVGPKGETTPSGAEEIYCDNLGRIRIRFHWQDQHGHLDSHAQASCWVRVAQRSAGGGMGSQYLSGGQYRLHTGQAIGMLAGAVKPGQANTGLQLIAAQQAIDIQAQSDTLKIQAKDQINIQSANAHIDWSAAKRISLSTAGGAT